VTSPKADGKKWQEIDKVSKDEAEKLAVHWNPERFFWQQLEIPFTELLRDLPGNSQVMQNWIEKLEQTACNALESVVNLVGTDGIALKATVRARTKLMFSLRELIPEPTKEVIE